MSKRGMISFVLFLLLLALSLMSGCSYFERLTREEQKPTVVIPVQPQPSLTPFPSPTPEVVVTESNTNTTVTTSTVASNAENVPCNCDTGNPVQSSNTNLAPPTPSPTPYTQCVVVTVEARPCQTQGTVIYQNDSAATVIEEKVVSGSTRTTQVYNVPQSRFSNGEYCIAYNEHDYAVCLDILQSDPKWNKLERVTCPAPLEPGAICYLFLPHQ